MITKTFGGAVYGVDAKLISIEVTIVNGTNFFMVGLPDSAIKESQHRIESVLKHLGKMMPRQRVIVNLAPASIKKEGASYDLPIALSVLKASQQVNLPSLEQYIIMGELALDGKLRPVTGVLPIAIEARKKGFKGFLLPEANAREAAIVNNIFVYGFQHIEDVIKHLVSSHVVQPQKVDTHELFTCTRKGDAELDFTEVKGQKYAKRALEIAAAGGHNLLMVGPPGAGKTMLAKRFPTILPPLTLKEALETTKIYSVAKKLKSYASLIRTRPFCAPHHTASEASLVGGGSIPRPGAISLAHNGVLFLDELPEFKRSVLEALRQPLEEKKVTISRAKLSLDFPANFMLLASMNPCPCGYYGHHTRTCMCSPMIRKKYLNKISGPLMDRIDIHLEVSSPSNLQLFSDGKAALGSDQLLTNVMRARKIQTMRYGEEQNTYTNAMLQPGKAQKFIRLPKEGITLLAHAKEKFALSARAYDKIAKLARTIADLAGTAHIAQEHVLEALSYRILDREKWAG